MPSHVAEPVSRQSYRCVKQCDTLRMSQRNSEVLSMAVSMVQTATKREWETAMYMARQEFKRIEDDY